MRNIRLLLLLILIVFPLPAVTANEEQEEYDWAMGLSVIAPGLPVALKIVNQPGDWGWQAEFNYFYLLGMARIDGRRVIKGSNGTDIYAFAGVTLNHFNGYVAVPSLDYLEFVLSADLGVGAQWRFTKHLSIGLEGGLMIPFWCNRGLDQFDNSGLMVANAYLMYWF